MTTPHANYLFSGGRALDNNSKLINTLLGQNKTKRNKTKTNEQTKLLEYLTQIKFQQIRQPLLFAYNI